MTIVTKLNLVSAPPDAPLIQLPSAEELELLNTPSLVARWVARAGYNAGDKWLDDKAAIPALLRRSTWPVLTNGGINSRPYLQQMATTAVMVASDGGENLWPASGAFSFVWVARPTSDATPANQAIFSTAASTSNAQAYVGYASGGASIQARNGPFLFINQSLGGVPSDHCIALSYDYADGSYVLYQNGIEIYSGVTNVMTPNPTRVSLFGGMGLTGTGVAQAGFNGRFYEGNVYNTALHKDADAKARLDAYISATYGL